MTESILAFWKRHPQYWIAGPLQEEADSVITSLYFKQDVERLNWLEGVIYTDQFMRHFSRVPSSGVKEMDVVAAREIAVGLVKSHLLDLSKFEEDELYFALMALKHAGEFDLLFEVLHDWLPAGASFTMYPILNRFYKDTYLKMISATALNVPCVSNIGMYDPDVCEACPPRTLWGHGSLPACGARLVSALTAAAGPSGILWISLSGGVDSNLLCALGRRAGLDVRAVHILYGNRPVAEMETAFVADLCAALDVKLYVYRVPWLRRASADREFYESTTRRLRFAAYKAVGAESGVCLGHIQEDVVENIWTNFAHGAHLGDLAKMSAAEEEDGVRILRPWLFARKADIYAVAEALNVPHLKNTTPAWSNRGKFRAAFYPATHAQYGADVDAKVLEVASALKTQSAMLDRLLFQPVFDSWKDSEVDVSPIFAAGGLDASGWLRVLTHFCHARLGISKPSIHACRDLSSRLNRPFDTLRIPLKRGLEVRFERCGTKVNMIFHTN